MAKQITTKGSPKPGGRPATGVSPSAGGQNGSPKPGGSPIKK